MPLSSREIITADAPLRVGARDDVIDLGGVRVEIVRLLQDKVRIRERIGHVDPGVLVGILREDRLLELPGKHVEQGDHLHLPPRHVAVPRQACVRTVRRAVALILGRLDLQEDLGLLILVGVVDVAVAVGVPVTVLRGFIHRVGLELHSAAIDLLHVVLARKDGSARVPQRVCRRLVTQGHHAALRPAEQLAVGPGRFPALALRWGGRGELRGRQGHDSNR
jgi:hypothetical protein